MCVCPRELYADNRGEKQLGNRQRKTIGRTVFIATEKCRQQKQMQKSTRPLRFTLNNPHSILLL